MHDYLIQHAFDRRLREVIPESTWSAAVDFAHATAELSRLEHNARIHGLVKLRLAILHSQCEAGDVSAARTLCAELIERVAAGDDMAITALAELHEQFGGDQYIAKGLEAVLAGRRAEDDGANDEAALAKLRARADAGAGGQLALLLAGRAAAGDDAALAELRTRGETGDRYASGQLDGVLAERGAAGDDAALAELRARTDAGVRGAGAQLAFVLAGRGVAGDDAALAELRRRAETGSEHAAGGLRRVLGERGGDGDDAALAELREHAEKPDGYHATYHYLAAEEVAYVLAARSARGDEGALSELRRRYDAGDWMIYRQLVEALRGRALAGDELALAELRREAIAGSMNAVEALIDVYAKGNDNRRRQLQLYGLDVNARPAALWSLRDL